MATHPKISLYALSDNRQFVTSTTNSVPIDLPPFTSGDIVQFSATLLCRNPLGGLRGTPCTIDVHEQFVRVGIVTPDPTTPVIYTVGTLPYVSAYGTYAGTLAISGSALGVRLGTENPMAATFEMEVTETGTNVGTYTWQQGCSVVADGLR